ncbi:uncharacterized protein [Amphiura filiformis]|uniref:uncharacterized protein n=1 Tax=Amphiura filiformis TaxID=82378 RepID=UPI003B20F622
MTTMKLQQNNDTFTDSGGSSGGSGPTNQPRFGRRHSLSGNTGANPDGVSGSISVISASLGKESSSGSNGPGRNSRLRPLSRRNSVGNFAEGPLLPLRRRNSQSSLISAESVQLPEPKSRCARNNKLNAKKDDRITEDRKGEDIVNASDNNTISSNSAQPSSSNPVPTVSSTLPQLSLGNNRRRVGFTDNTYSRRSLPSDILSLTLSATPGSSSGIIDVSSLRGRRPSLSVDSDPLLWEMNFERKNRHFGPMSSSRAQAMGKPSHSLEFQKVLEALSPDTDANAQQSTENPNIKVTPPKQTKQVSRGWSKARIKVNAAVGMSLTSKTRTRRGSECASHDEAEEDIQKDKEGEEKQQDKDSKKTKEKKRFPKSRGWIIVKRSLPQIAEMAPPRTGIDAKPFSIKNICQLVKAKEFRMMMKRRASFMENGRFQFDEAKADLYDRYKEALNDKSSRRNKNKSPVAMVNGDTKEDDNFEMKYDGKTNSGQE